MVKDKQIVKLDFPHQFAKVSNRSRWAKCRLFQQELSYLKQFREEIPSKKLTAENRSYDAKSVF